MSDIAFQPVALPPTCRLSHQGATLSNGAKLLVVTDPDTQTCAAAMTVGVGSHWDPPTSPGLAHLCEHMLFLGTERLPTEGAFDKFITQNGGHTNAWTTDRATTYYFTTTKSPAFGEALTQFVPFFHCPLLTASAYEREVEAVHSEDEKNHSVDYWRQQEIMKQELYHPDHPSSQYGNGNKTTLFTEPIAKGIDVTAHLRAFYERHYVAPHMTLVVYSHLSASEVAALVNDDLNKLKAATSPATAISDSWPTAPFRSDVAGSWINVETVQDLQHLVVLFPVASQRRFHDGSYASHILGHECEGTLLSVLKDDGLATDLSCGVGRGIDNDFDWLNISIGLSPEGVLQVDRVLQLLGQAIALLRRHGATLAGVTEMRDEAEVRFQFAEISSRPYSHCTTLANGAYDASITDAWRHAHNVESLGISDQEVVQRMDALVQSLDLRKACFMLCMKKLDDPARLPANFAPCQNIQLDRVGRFHGTKYNRVAVAKDTLESWAAGGAPEPRLHMPAANPFLTNDFAVQPLAAESVVPVVLADAAEVDGLGTLWFKPDDRFSVPKAVMLYSIDNAEAYASPLDRFNTRVFVHIVKHAMTETRYFAELSSLHSSMQANVNGLDIEVGGPSATMPRLIESMLKAVYTAPATEELFTVYADQVRREVLSIRGQQPYVLANSTLSAVNRLVVYDYEEVIDASSRATFAAFQSTVSRFRAKARVEKMGGGNATAAAIKALAVTIRDAVFIPHAVKAVPSGEIPRTSDVVIVPSRAQLSTWLASAGAPAVFGSVIVRRTPNPEDGNAAVVVEHFLGSNTPELAVAAEVLAASFSSDFFNQLRTNETMGYVVQSSCRRVDGVVSIVFLVQSAAANASYILGRILAYIDTIEARLALQTDAEFESTRAASIAQREEKPKNSVADVCATWGRRKHTHGFDHQVKEIAALRTLTKESILTLFRDYVANASTKARVLISACCREPSAAFGDLSALTGDAPEPVRAAFKSTVFHGTPRTTPKSSDELSRPVQIADAPTSPFTLAVLNDLSGVRSLAAHGLAEVHRHDV